MSGKNAKLLRRFCEATQRKKAQYRRAKKNYSVLSVDLRDSYRDVIFDQTRKVLQKLNSLKYA